MKELLKPWNPYIRRHSSLTEKSGILKEHHLRQFAGWSPDSNMHLKYLHYFGNESSEGLLEAYGVISKDKQLSNKAVNYAISLSNLSGAGVFKIKLSNKKGTKEIGSADNGPDGSLDRNPLDKNKDAYQTGLNIANLITYFWNSQKNPGKVYISNRRVHHGEIGSLLGLSSLLKKSRPVPSGILSGLGEGLVKDDYADKDEWFTFKKKKNDKPQTSETNTNAMPTNEKKE